MTGTRPALAVDTAPWIHWIEENPDFLPALTPIFEPVMRGDEFVVTSVLAMLEVMTGAYLRGRETLARRYQDLFSDTQGVVLVDVDPEIAVRAARLRARYRIRTPDAIHIATAVVTRAQAFLTTDRRLARVKDIEVRVLRPAAALARARRGSLK